MNTEILQIVIIASLSISTILFTIIAIQTILLLKEVKSIVKKINSVSNGLHNVVRVVEKSLADMKGITEIAVFAGNLFSKVLRKKNHDSAK